MLLIDLLDVFAQLFVRNLAELLCQVSQLSQLFLQQTFLFRRLRIGRGQADGEHSDYVAPPVLELLLALVNLKLSPLD